MICIPTLISASSVVPLGSPFRLYSDSIRSIPITSVQKLGIFDSNNEQICQIYSQITNNDFIRTKLTRTWLYSLYKVQRRVNVAIYRTDYFEFSRVCYLQLEDRSCKHFVHVFQTRLVGLIVAARGSMFRERLK